VLGVEELGGGLKGENIYLENIFIYFRLLYIRAKRAPLAYVTAPSTSDRMVDSSEIIK
jgi:hypothetical protein